VPSMCTVNRSNSAPRGRNIRRRRRCYGIPEPKPAYMMRSRAGTERLRPEGTHVEGFNPFTIGLRSIQGRGERNQYTGSRYKDACIISKQESLANYEAIVMPMRRIRLYDWYDLIGSLMCPRLV